MKMMMYDHDIDDNDDVDEKEGNCMMKTLPLHQDLHINHDEN